MLKRLIIMLVLVAGISAPAAAWAQTKVEISPFVAWRHGNDLRDVSGITVDLESGTAYGFMVDVSVMPNVQVEFVYSNFRTGASVFVPVDIPGGPITAQGDGNIDYYQGGLLYQWDLQNPKIKPFIVGTLGAAYIRPVAVDESTWSFSWSGGMGVKIFFNEHIGIRTEYRIFSTSTEFVGRGGWCNWWGFCYTFLTSQRLYQSQVAAALIIGF